MTQLRASVAILCFAQTGGNLPVAAYDQAGLLRSRFLAFEISQRAIDFCNSVSTQTFSASTPPTNQEMDDFATAIVTKWNAKGWTAVPRLRNHKCTPIGCIPGAGPGALYDVVLEKSLATIDSTVQNPDDVRQVAAADGLHARYVLTVSY